MTRPAYRVRLAHGEPVYRHSEGGALAIARSKVEMLALWMTPGEAWAAVDRRPSDEGRWREIHQLEPRSQEAPA